MGGIRLLCRQHPTIRIGGCDCLGALDRFVDCPDPEGHEQQLRASDGKPGASRGIVAWVKEVFQ